MKQVEDVNETLYYVEDLLEVTHRKNPKVYAQLKNAMLNYAYYPTIV